MGNDGVNAGKYYQGHVVVCGAGGLLVARKSGAADRLRRLSKDDLIWVINRLLQMGWLQNGEHYLLRALSELECEKERQRQDEADRYLSISLEKRKEFAAVLAPYDGMKFLDIPRDVLLRADALQKEAVEAEKKWCKLLGLKAN